jgi:flagellar hook-associated protein 1
MSTPAFFGFYNAQRGLIAAQAGLDVANHNISNANTPGYTKQRLDLTQATPYQTPTPGSSLIYQFGQGVTVNAITRVRDTFLDTQFRQETANSGALDVKKDIFNQVEDVVGEPNDTGLANGIQQLFNAIQDMSNRPESLASRSAFLQQATDLTFQFQQQGKQLLDLHRNLVGTNGNATSLTTSQLGLSVDEINTHLANLAAINEQIGTVVSSGGNANDLQDKRTVILNELATLADVTVTEQPNQQVQVDLGGQTLVKGRFVVDTLTVTANTGINADAVPGLITTTIGAVDITAGLTGGKLKGILDATGLDGAIKNVYQTFTDLNTVFDQLATAFNAVQQAGRDLSGTQRTPPDPSADIFSLDPAYVSGPKLAFYKVNQALVDAPQTIALAADDPTATANFAGPGDSRNAKAFGALRSQGFVPLGSQTFENFHQTLVARLGTNTKSFQDRSASQKGLLQQLEGRQSSVSGVNMDEETIDLVKFQQAYQASSRVIKTYNDIFQAILSMV